MAEEQEIVDSLSAEVNPDQKVDMEVETATPKAETGDEKREREETEEEENGGESKKQKVGEEEKSGPVKLGPKEFVTSVAMFDYFVKFLHFWPTDLDVNKVIHIWVYSSSLSFGFVYCKVSNFLEIFIPLLETYIG
ncbi:unnamed protein product [Arabidopsis thaliana]|nr:unnamed protein product [Arabidopsis thaliana]